MNIDFCLWLLPLIGLLIFGLIFGADIDRAYIIRGLFFVALGLAGGVPTYGKKGEALDA